MGEAGILGGQQSAINITPLPDGPKRARNVRSGSLGAGRLRGGGGSRKEANLE